MMDTFAFVPLLVSALRSSTPMAFVLTGEVMGQRAGLVNIGVEGQMLIGASMGFAAAVVTGNPWLGLACGCLAGACLSAAYGLLCLTLKANQITSGVAVLILGSGLSAYFGTPYAGQLIEGFAMIHVQPVPAPVAELLRQITPTMMLGLMAPIAAGSFLYQTRWGLNWRAVGESTEASKALGLRPHLYRWMAVLLGGVLSGLGGAALSVDYTKGWSEGMTSGRGLLAVGLVVITRWNPYWTTPVSMIFGAAETLSLTLQFQGVPLSPYLLATLPYLVPLAVLVAGAAFGKSLNRMPGGLNEVLTAK
jgi:general nucleoside transport system permease protein